MEDILIGTTDRTIPVFILDPAQTDGSGKTGLAHTDITVTYTRYETDNDVVLTDVTGSLSALANLTAAHSDWGWFEVGGGEYRLDVADALFASGAWYTVLKVSITTSAAAATPKAFKLVAYNPLDGVRLGLTALPNAAADAAGGLPISDAGGLDLDAISARLGTPSDLGSGATVASNLSDIHNHTTDIVDATTIYSGSASSGSTTTLVDAGLTQGDDYWNDCWVKFTSGNNIGQVRRITAFTASSDTVTFWPPVANSVTTHSYVIIPAATARAVLAADIAHGGGTASLTLEDLTVTGEFAMNTLVVAAGASFNLTGNITGNLSGSVGSVTAAITLPTIPTNWITADGIAEDAIGASELAADVFSSITSSVWGAATRVLTAGTNIQLPSNGLANVTAWTVALTGNITGNLSGSVGSVTGAVGSVTGTVGGIAGTITTLDALDAAQDLRHDTTQAKTNLIPAAPAAVGDAMALTSAYDLYHADINFAVDEANSRDEYTITWFKNGARLTSGVTSPTIQVVKRADGTDLIASTSISEIGSTESFYHNATTTARTTAGEAVLVIVTATIDAGTRTFSKIVSRDSEAP